MFYIIGLVAMFFFLFQAHTLIGDLRQMHWKEDSGHIICVTIATTICVVAFCFVIFLMLAKMHM